MVTKEVIKAIAPEIRQDRLEALSSIINPILDKYNINNKLRVAHFLAQAAHESGGFNRMEENLMYSSEGLLKTFSKYFKTKAEADKYARNKQAIANKVYGSRMGNGDEKSGDGWKYRGRGYFQLTGRDNYSAASKALKIDLVNNPDLAMEVETALEIAAWYFKSKGCEKAADNDSLEGVTKLINGGLIGLDHRKQLLGKAKTALSL